METPPSTNMQPRPEPARHSPCVGVCRLDAATGWCLGCGRTTDEIAAWLAMGDGERLAVWAELEARLARLAVGIRLLPWTRSDIRDWAGATFGAGGTWVIGGPGALAEFPCGTARGIEVGVSDGAIEARARDGTFRLMLHDRLRAFSSREGPIVLGLPKVRATLASHATFAALGRDSAAIDPQHRTHERFDFGIGRQASRFTLRTGDGALVDLLRAQTGKSWTEALRGAGAAILQASPHRVVESVLARIEVFSRIPAAGEASPDGAHTHFLPSFLDSSAETPAALALPEFAWPIAIYYPPRDTR